MTKLLVAGSFIYLCLNMIFEWVDIPQETWFLFFGYCLTLMVLNTNVKNE